jgi:hypothetical protein
MICSICFAVRNNNKHKGDLVDLILCNGKVMCYRCVAQVKVNAEEWCDRCKTEETHLNDLDCLAYKNEVA